MREKITLLALGLLIASFSVGVGSPIRPLAQEYVVVGESPDPALVPLYNPSIVRLDSGRLVAAYRLSGKRVPTLKSETFILTSDDGGETWQNRATVFAMGQTRLFTSGDDIYQIGSGKDLKINRSRDNGETWSEPAIISDGHWHQTASNFLEAKGNIYLSIEKRVGKEIQAWAVGELAPVLMRAKIGSDLTLPESWTFASEIAFMDIIKGYRNNEPEINYFGVPYYEQAFPTRNILARKPLNRSSAPMGWLESNVVQVTDPTHYWYDPLGRTFHLMMRAHTGGTGYAALAKVVENDDGTMTTSLQKVPSGKDWLFLPLPGGQMRFHITYDPDTKLYWLLSTQSTDSMTRAELLSEDRYSLPNNERDRLVLHFSKNLVDWCFAGLVAKTESPRQARHYASMAIDGDDLVILSRSGDERARNAHDGNLITFHRVKDFRELVY